MPDMEAARRFCGVDPNDEEQMALLEVCRAAAEAWYAAAGVAARENDPLYDFWVCNLTAWFYDNRGADNSLIPPSIIASLHQLRGVVSQ